MNTFKNRESVILEAQTPDNNTKQEDQFLGFLKSDKSSIINSYYQSVISNIDGQTQADKDDKPQNDLSLGLQKQIEALWGMFTKNILKGGESSPETDYGKILESSIEKLWSNFISSVSSQETPATPDNIDQKIETLWNDFIGVSPDDQKTNPEDITTHIDELWDSFITPDTSEVPMAAPLKSFNSNMNDIFDNILGKTQPENK